jgi:cation:H+ antiporter
LLVLFSGTKLARYGDVIAEKTGLSGLWVGVLLLAIVTSLPEVITGVSAVTAVGGDRGPDLAVGTIFGSNLFNLVIIAVLDIISRGPPLLSRVGTGHWLSGGLGIALMALAGGSILLGTRVWDGAVVGWVGIYSFALIILYLWGSRAIFRFERRKRPEQEVRALRYENISPRRAYFGFAIAALAIIGAGTWLAFIGDELAEITGWDATFIGSLFLAATTSLPELAVSISALRIGAVDMAIADMLGSNMFNVGIGIAGIDLLYHHGSIFSAPSESHVFTASIVVLMTLIVVAGLAFGTKKKTFRVMSWYSPALIGIYIIGAYVLFTR